MKYVLTLLLVLFISSCSLKTQTKAPQNLRLTTPLVKTYQTKDHSISIHLIDSISYAYSKDFIYSDKKGVYNRFINSRWDERLSSQTQKLLINTLRNSKLYTNVVTPSSLALYDYILEVSIDTFEYSVINEPKVIVKMNFTLINSNTKTAVTKTFTVEKNTQSKDAYGALRAYDKAIKELIDQMLIWLNKIS